MQDAGDVKQKAEQYKWKWTNYNEIQETQFKRKLNFATNSSSQ